MEEVPLDRNMFVSSCAYVFCAESQTFSILTKILASFEPA